MLEADRLAADESVAAFPLVPPQIRALGDLAHFFDDVLADVGEIEVAGARVPRIALRIPHAVRIDLGERVRIVVVGKWIVLRNAVLAVRAVLPERIDAEYLAERRAEVLRIVERIAAAPAIGDAHVEETVVGAVRRRE